MTASLYWLQGGACGGDTHSLLNAESPDLLQLLHGLDLKVLWHPSFTCCPAESQDRIYDDLASGKSELDVLCLEGSVIRGPGGTGMFDTRSGRPKKDMIRALATRARFVIAVGTCASFGGFGSGSVIEATGLQFSKSEFGGFLGQDFKTLEGLPVINLPGCPAHCDPVTGTISMLLQGEKPQLNEWNSPLEWYGMLVHQGCTRNEYHEYRVEERHFGEAGCLFFHLGCHGPLVYGPCNKYLWNSRSSKTRVGVPCVGCTRPEFPQEHPFFMTPSIEEIPLDLPDGVDRAHYLAYKGMAAAAAPKRLKDRKTKV